MNKKWEIREVCTPEQTFEKINTKMAQPVGIVLFGADCDFKNEVVDELLDNFTSVNCWFNQPPDTSTLAKAFSDFKTVMVIMEAERSAMHPFRHELVKLMRNLGAKTVVGIYAKCKMQLPLFLQGCFNRETVSLATQIKAIEQSNPTADGLDYFIVVEEEEG